MSSIAALVMLGVIGGGGSVLGRCRRCILSSSLSVGWCGRREIEAKCLFSMLDCSLGVGMVSLFDVIASWVSGVSVYLLLRLRMSLQSLEGLVLNVMVSSSCFHVVCCSRRISSDISLFSVWSRLMISGVGNWRRRWFLVRILSLICLL